MPPKPHVATCAEVWAMLTNPELELEVEEEAPDDIEGSGASSDDDGDPFH